jgi:hypothetical protein
MQYELQPQPGVYMPVLLLLLLFLCFLKVSVNCDAHIANTIIICHTPDSHPTDAPLGDHYDASMGKHVISVWAPTAHIVEVLHWEQLRGGEPAVYGMTRSAQGVWTYVRPAEWKGT